MDNELVKFKNDKFRKARGGYSRWILISCAKCGAALFPYQKDGPGILKRLYVDRIVGKVKPKSNLACDSCGELVGIPVLYKKEKRPAIRLFAGAIEKQITSKNKVKKFLNNN